MEIKNNFELGKTIFLVPKDAGDRRCDETHILVSDHEELLRSGPHLA